MRTDGGSGDRFAPVLAIPFGSLVGANVGLLVGLVLLDGIAMPLVVGAASGMLLGVVVFALLSSAGDDPEPPSSS